RGDPHLLPRVMDRARKGRLRIVGEGHNRVDITHVHNGALAHIRALEALAEGRPVGGRAYFISQGEPVKLWPWINEVLSRAGISPVRKRMSLPAACRAGAIAEAAWKTFRLGGEPPITRFVATELGKSH